MPTDLERDRELRAFETRAVQMAELAKLTEEHRLKQRSDARKSEIEAAKAALAELERRNAEEDAFDQRVAVLFAAEQKAAAELATHTAEQRAVAGLRAGAPVTVPVAPVPKTVSPR